ncbi:MAG: DMT family transporter [Alphaproteobacteria bacterium]|jgi:drug/metabolite transporter (DMT)-like permease|nr:DMT family transporter [Rhodospirillaceae bacterium]MBT6512032.1 DMT family transporter [Rhodospirillaceae bacterium]MDG2480103.1 DMT family transporter [Alphaproteobacteria bacterium]
MSQSDSERSLGVSVAIPTLFVLLWSSGFIAAKTGVQYSGPLTFLALRFALVTFLMLGVALAMRAPWPRTWGEVGHYAVLGLLMQVVYFGAAWISMSNGVGAGTAALIVSMQPILTAVVAGPVLGEVVGRRQWVGLAIGFVGVGLVVEQKLVHGLGTPMGITWSFISLLGITVGTLYQKRKCPNMDPRTGGLVQFITAAAILTVLALLFEEGDIEWTGEFIAALFYVAVFLSLISITLLTVMIKRGQASRMTSLFFLVPPITAVMAWAILGETMTWMAIGGLACVVLGVALVVLPPSVWMRK